MTLADFATTKTREYTPGPGSYDVENYKGVGRPGSVMYTIRPKYCEKDPLTSKIDYPSERPGLTPMDKTIGPIIGMRNSDSILKNKLGPEYLPNPNEFFSKSVRIKDKLKDPDPNMNNPGPGAYSPNHEFCKKTIPQMGSRGPIDLGRNGASDSPGPSAYSIQRNKSDTPIYTIRPKTSDDRYLNSQLKNPNPGYAYNNLNNDIGKDSPRYGFPRAQKIEAKTIHSPGPGHYDQKLQKSGRISTAIRPKYDFDVGSKSNKLDIPLEDVRRFPESNNYSSKIGEKYNSGFWTKDNGVPGPAYTPVSAVSSKENKEIKIGEKFKDKNSSLSPGPSDYFPQDPGKKGSPLFSCKGPISRDDWLPRDKGIPGPGQYLIKSGNNLPKWSIGDKSRNGWNDDDERRNNRTNKHRNFNRNNGNNKTNEANKTNRTNKGRQFRAKSATREKKRGKYINGSDDNDDVDF